MTTPKLKIDGDRPVRALSRLERRIAWTLLNEMLQIESGIFIAVDDGESVTQCGRNALDAMELIFDLDDCVLLFGGGRWVRLVMGNGDCVISDCSFDGETMAACVTASSVC